MPQVRFPTLLGLGSWVVCALSLSLILAQPALANTGPSGFELRRLPLEQRQDDQIQNLVQPILDESSSEVSTVIQDVTAPATTLMTTTFTPGSGIADLFSPTQLATIASQALKIHRRYSNVSDPSVEQKIQLLTNQLQWATDLLTDQVMDVTKNLMVGVHGIGALPGQSRAIDDKGDIKATKPEEQHHEAGHAKKTHKGVHHHKHHKAAHHNRHAKTGIQKQKKKHDKLAFKAASKNLVHVPLEIQLNPDGYQMEPNAWFTIGEDRYLMTVDSGSTVAWLKGSKFPGKNSKGLVHDQQVSGKGNANKGFTIRYGLGQVKGKFRHVDLMGLGSLKIKNLAVGAAGKLTKNFRQDKADGVMGLAFRELSKEVHSGPTFLERVFSGDNKLDSNVVCIAAQKDPKKSSLQFGGADSSLFKGDMAWSSINKVGFWQLNIDSFAAIVPDAPKKANDSKPVVTAGTPAGITDMDIILDSGTSLIVAGPDGAKAFWKGVAGSEFHKEYELYTFPCSTKLSAELKLDGKTYTLGMDHLSLGPMKAGSDRCIGSVGAMDTQGVIVWGLAGLRAMYTCMDHDKKSIGLANPSW